MRRQAVMVNEQIMKRDEVKQVCYDLFSLASLIISLCCLLFV